MPRKTFDLTFTNVSSVIWGTFWDFLLVVLTPVLNYFNVFFITLLYPAIHFNVIAPKRIQTVIRAFCDFYQWCDCRIEAIINVKKQKKIKEKKQLLDNLVREKQNLQEELNNIFITIGQLQDSKKEVTVLLCIELISVAYVFSCSFLQLYC